MAKEDQVRSVSRALSILKYLETCDGVSLSQMGRDLDLPKTTALRILSTLEDDDFVYHTSMGDYHLGSALIRLGATAERKSDIVQIGAPFMEEITQRLNETASINIVKNLHRICLAKSECTHSLRSFINVGDVVVLYKGASSKVMLAHLSETVQQQVFDSIPEEEKSMIPELMQELQEIKANGYATSIGNRIPGAATIAVPIFGKNGKLAGNLSISGAAVRFPPESVEKNIYILKESAQILSRKMGAPQR